MEQNNMLSIYQIGNSEAKKLGQYQFNRKNIMNGIEGFRVVDEIGNEIEMLAVLIGDSKLILQF